MDPVTHTLVGVSLAATRLQRPTRYAVPALVIGANLPDIGVLSYFAGLMVGPVPAVPSAWEFVVEQNGRLRHGRFDWLGDRSPTFSEFDHPAASSDELWPEIEASGQSRGFLSWVRFPWIEVDATQAGSRVFVMDARYVRSRTRGFGGGVISLRDEE